MEKEQMNSPEKRTPLNVYEQRFEMLMKLIRIDRMLKSAKIIPSEKK